MNEPRADLAAARATFSAPSTDDRPHASGRLWRYAVWITTSGRSRSNSARTASRVADLDALPGRSREPAADSSAPRYPVAAGDVQRGETRVRGIYRR